MDFDAVSRSTRTPTTVNHILVELPEDAGGRRRSKTIMMSRSSSSSSSSRTSIRRNENDNRYLSARRRWWWVAGPTVTSTEERSCSSQHAALTKDWGAIRSSDGCRWPDHENEDGPEDVAGFGIVVVVVTKILLLVTATASAVTFFLLLATAAAWPTPIKEGATRRCAQVIPEPKSAASSNPTSSAAQHEFTSAFPRFMYHTNAMQDHHHLEGIGSHHRRKDHGSFPCQPRRVRIAQRNDTDPSANVDSVGLVSMTLSFELDRIQCPPTAVHQIVLDIQEIEGSSSFVGSHHDRGMDRPPPDRRRRIVVVPGTTAAGDVKVAEESATSTTSIEPIQFDYQTEAMRMDGNQVFHSDFIYHVPLDRLRSGPVRYSYRIHVIPTNDSQPHPPSAVDDDVRRGDDEHRHGVDASPSFQQKERRRLRHLSGSLSSSAGTSRDGADNCCYEGTLVTPPKSHTPTRLALVGDLGQTWYSTLTMLHIWKEANLGRAASSTTTLGDRSHRNDTDNTTTKVPVTNLVIAGDMSYADSDPNRWTSWFELMEPLLRALPTHVAAGNHELECDRYGNLFTFYEKCFVSPNRVQEPYQLPFSKRPWEVWKLCSHPSQFQAVYDYGNAYYSYEHGLAKVVVLSSYSHTDVNSTQYRWLQKELSSQFSRDRTPWLIVVFHSPFYTTFLGHQDEIQSVTMREAMEDLFVQHGVNLVVSGHDHAYLRTHPMYQGQVVSSGRAPIYWTLGAGGNREGHSQGYVHVDPEPWVAKRSLADFGYGSLLMPNATHAQLTWKRDGVGIGLNVDEMAIEDDVWIVNPYTTASALPTMAVE